MLRHMKGVDPKQVKMAKLAKIILNGFVKRTLNTDALKAGIKSTGATLTRKGRSRNWILEADSEQIRQIINLISQSGEDSWLWVGKKLYEYRPKLSRAELKKIAKRDPSMTVAQLTLLADCTLIDARTVLDEIEWE
ncbi:MAG: ribosome recycling factor family protein [Bermanella sp.]